EDDQVGIVDQGLGEAQAPDHAFRILAQATPAGVAQADHLDELADALVQDLPGDAEDLAEEAQGLLGVEELVEVGLFRQVADAVLDLLVAGIAAEDEGVATGRRDEAEEELDRGGLARAVGAEQ